MVHTAHQLRCAGVLEAIRVSRMAYPNRMPHASFVKRYALLAAGKWLEDNASGIGECRTAPPGDAGACATCTSLLASVVDDAKRFQLGKTKVRLGVRGRLRVLAVQDQGAPMHHAPCTMHTHTHTHTPAHPPPCRSSSVRTSWRVSSSGAARCWRRARSRSRRTSAWPFTAAASPSPGGRPPGCRRRSGGTARAPGSPRTAPRRCGCRRPSVRCARAAA
eukprot:scaffold43101_cov51-Phaeocystis_antarctica.AAC.2